MPSSQQPQKVILASKVVKSEQEIITPHMGVRRLFSRGGQNIPGGGKNILFA